MRSTILLALAALAVALLFHSVSCDDPTADLYSTEGVSNEPETSEVDDLATRALPAMYRDEGWRYHKNKKCSYKWKKARSCPPSPPYCCGGSRCRYPVPEPPPGLPHNAVRPLSRSGAVMHTQQATQFGVPNNVVMAPLNQTVHDLALCDENPRKAVPLPWTGANEATALVNIQFQVNSRKHTLTCTGQLISPYMVLLATHCVSNAELEKTAPGVKLESVKVCLNYNPQGGSSLGLAVDFNCPPDGQNGVITRAAIGVSLNTDWKKAGDPNDYAIVFLEAPIDLPTYFKYNYVENINLDNVDNMWQSRSFTGEGSPANGSQRGRCGCTVCRYKDVTCNLAVAGPYTNAVPLTKYNTSDPTELPTFLNPPLAICGGSSGSCLTVNEDTCCVGITSFEFLQPKVCDSSCSANYWSTISIQFPLSKLWFMVQIHLRP